MSMFPTSLLEGPAPASQRFARETRRSPPAPPRPCPWLSGRVKRPHPQEACNTRSIALLSRLGTSPPCGVTQLAGMLRHLRSGWTGDTHPMDRRGSEISETGTRSRSGAGPGRRRARASRYCPDRGGRTGRRTAPRAFRAKHSSGPTGLTRIGSDPRRAGGSPAAPGRARTVCEERFSAVRAVRDRRLAPRNRKRSIPSAAPARYRGMNGSTAPMTDRTPPLQTGIPHNVCVSTPRRESFSARNEQRRSSCGRQARDTGYFCSPA